MAVLKKMLCILCLLWAHSALAGVEINQADAQALRTIKGIGPGLSQKMVAERAKGAFQDWADLIDRVKGIGPQTAVKLSQEGLTVGGSAYSPVSGAVADKPRRTTLQGYRLKSM
jgi:competence protein ComEA